MNRPRTIALLCIVACCLASRSDAQTDTAKDLANRLDEVINLGQFRSELGSLEKLKDRLDTPVLIDRRAIKVVGLSPATSIAATVGPMPLRSALRKLLQPHGLRAVIKDSGLVITVDFTVWTRRGVATDSWVKHDSAENQRIRKTLGQKISVDINQVALRDLVSFVSGEVEIPMVIDQRSLAEVGLDIGTPVSKRLTNVSLRAALKLILRDLELTYVVKDEVLQITTVEAAEQKPMTRIYFIEGLGFRHDELDSVRNLIQSTVAPATWSLTGSEIARLNSMHHKRPALVVTTAYYKHEQIAELMAALRQSQAGRDPGESIVSD